MSDRRRFLQNTGMLLAGGTVLSTWDNKAFASLHDRISAADQINIGAIGVKGMGFANVTSALKIPGVNIVALCDVDKNVLD